MQVALIGYRGTGKSTVARLLARRWGLAWADADAEIEACAGRTIRQIFAEQGEPRFRELEADVIAELSRRQDLVLALGGGAVMRGENRQALGGWQVVWLTAAPATLAARMAADRQSAQRRPDLLPGGGLAEIETLLTQRAPLYRQCAQWEVSTEQKTAEQVADEIACLLKP